MKTFFSHTLLLTSLTIPTGTLYSMKRSAEDDLNTQLKKQKLTNEPSSSGDYPNFNHFAGEIPPDMQSIAQAIKIQTLLTEKQIESPRALLITGQSGVGKTLLAHALAGETNSYVAHHSGVDLMPIDACLERNTEMVRTLSSIFDQAQYQAQLKRASRAIVLIDSWDILINSRMEKAKFQLLNYIKSCLNGSYHGSKPPLLLIAESTDQDLPLSQEERFYSFFKKIVLDAPNETNRKAILDLYSTPHTKETSNLDTQLVAQKTANKTGRELKELINQAAILAYFEAPLHDPGKPLKKRHLLKKLKDLAPAIPNNTPDILMQLTCGAPQASYKVKNEDTCLFSDIAGTIPEDVQELVENIKECESFAEYGLTPPRGILLSGPTGTGKTLLARAVAGEVGAGFFTASGSEFIEKYVGVGAKNVRALFEQAKKYVAATPDGRAIIFIDEIDAVGCKRGDTDSGGDSERRQTINELLNQIDGFTSKNNITIIAATNTPQALDPALIRPGRFDKKIEVGLPDSEKRKAILQFYAKKIPATKTPTDLNYDALAAKTDGLNSAELKQLVTEAKSLARRAKAPSVSQSFFDAGLEVILKQRTEKSPPPPMMYL